MVSRLPRWVWVGAWLLACVAGMVNVVGLQGFQHQAITHLTGNTSLLGEAIGDGNLSAVAHFACLMGAFVAGAAVSGLMIGDSTLRLGRRYGLGLVLVSALLLLSIPFFDRGQAVGMYLAAVAIGFQNAMVSTYSGAVVRTTHVSGMFTDLGIAMGHSLRRMPVDRRRLSLCLSVITGFLAGGIAGTLAFRRIGYDTLLIPAGLTFLAAAAYGIYLAKERHVRGLPPNQRA